MKLVTVKLILWYLVLIFNTMVAAFNGIRSYEHAVEWMTRIPERRSPWASSPRGYEQKVIIESLLNVLRRTLGARYVHCHRLVANFIVEYRYKSTKSLNEVVKCKWPLALWSASLYTGDVPCSTYCSTVVSKCIWMFLKCYFSCIDSHRVTDDSPQIKSIILKVAHWFVICRGRYK